MTNSPTEQIRSITTLRRARLFLVLVVALAAGDAARAADDQTFWAFQTPRKGPIPAVRRDDLVRTPIDAFLLARLESKDLTSPGTVLAACWRGG